MHARWCHRATVGGAASENYDVNNRLLYVFEGENKVPAAAVVHLCIQERGLFVGLKVIKNKESIVLR